MREQLDRVTLCIIPCGDRLCKQSRIGDEDKFSVVIEFFQHWKFFVYAK